MIEVKDDLIDPELVSVVAGTTEAKGWKYGWRSNQALGYAHFNQAIVKCSKKNISPIDLPSPMSNLWGLMRQGLPEGAYPIRCYANLHTHGTEGYPHTDSERDNETTMVLYLNKEWKREYGGETAFYEGQDIVKSVMPKFGRVVMFTANIVHCARAVSRVCPIERVTAMIKARHPHSDPDLMALDRFLTQIGAGSKKHKDGSLKDHLIRCYEILRAKGVSREVYIAGGLHSVLGTQHYKDRCRIDASGIELKFGLNTGILVNEFSEYVDGEPASEELNLMRAANLKDQDSLKKHPDLKMMWDNWRPS